MLAIKYRNMAGINVASCLGASGGDRSLYWPALLVISLTVNFMVVVYLCITASLAAIGRRMRALYGKKRTIHEAGTVMDNMTTKHRQHVAMLFTEALVTLLLFSGAIYLLVDGAIANGFMTNDMAGCRLVTATTVLFSVAIGRLGVALVADIRRIRSSDKLEMTSQSARQLLEHGLMLIVFVTMTPSTDALLTRTLLCVMAIDHNVVNFGLLLEKSGADRSDMLVRAVDVISCFMSLAFRGVLPFVSLLVSVLVFPTAILDMEVKAIAIVIACAIVYTCYNIYVILTSMIRLWLTCSVPQRVSESPEVGRFRANNELAVNRKSAPIDLHLNKLNLADTYRGSCGCTATGNNRGMARQHAKLYDAILSRINFAPKCRSCPAPGDVSPEAADAYAATTNLKNDSEYSEKQNCDVSIVAEKNSATRKTCGKISNLEKRLTFLDTIDEETESVTN